MTLKEQLDEAGRKLAEEYARDLAGPPPRMPTDSRDLNAKLEERLWYCTEWAASKAYLAGRESLAPLVIEMAEALGRIAERNGFCIMGPPSEERDEMIVALNGDCEELVRRAFELGSARTNADCAAEASTCLANLAEKLGRGK